MDETKKKKIEEKLRQLLILAEQSKDEKRPSAFDKPSGPRVIRRRKGAPDRPIG